MSGVEKWVLRLFKEGGGKIVCWQESTQLGKDIVEQVKVQPGSVWSTTIQQQNLQEATKVGEKTCLNRLVDTIVLGRNPDQWARCKTLADKERGATWVPGY